MAVKKRVLINASNLHVGGGVQVAVSFLMELESMLQTLPFSVDIWASSEVSANLLSSGSAVLQYEGYKTIDTFGLRFLFSRLQVDLMGYDLVFTVFGPVYSFLSMHNHVVGFAQPLIIYPDVRIGKEVDFLSGFVSKVKFGVQWFFFRRAGRLVVELGHVRERLVNIKCASVDRVDVVNNCVSSIYFDEAKWLSVPGLKVKRGGVIRLGLVARDYPHKNLDFLLQLARELRECSDLCFEFYVTLDCQEWDRRESEFKREIINVGPLSVAQCPDFYRFLNGVVFPSLLECFSATPIEAMVMKVPLFASDRGFVRDCCREHAVYFDPLNPKSAAKVISDWFMAQGPDARLEWVENAYRHVKALPNSRDRALAYVGIIGSCLD